MGRVPGKTQTVHQPPGSAGPATGQRGKSPLPAWASFDLCLCRLDLRCTNPWCSGGVHLNMIKQPLGLRGGEMEIYRLPNLHLNANAASRPPGTTDPSSVKVTTSLSSH